MNRRIFTLALVACVAASLALAEPPEKYREWAAGPAGYLLTKAERKEFEKISTEAQAEKFIELFWAKRDPDLETVINEFKLDFDQRVAAADKQFGADKQKGSMTDRGKVLILLGRPSGFSSQPVTAMPGRIERGEDNRGASEIWTYKKDRLPEGIKAEEVHIFFQETRPGVGDFTIERSHVGNVMGMKLINEAPERYVLHPKLTEPPRLGLLRGSKAATSDQLAVFAQQPAPWPEGGRALVNESLLSAASHVLWLYVELPNSVPAAGQAIGRVRRQDGTEAGSFAVAVTPTSVASGRAYEFSLPLDPGSYSIDLALVGDAGPVAVKTIEGTVTEVPGDGTYFSPFYWGVDVRQEAQAFLGAAFNIGGWHVLPRLSNEYQSTESLSYFCYVLRPARDEQGNPVAKVALALYGEGKEKPLSQRPAETVQLSLVNQEADLWMYGSGLPLSIFKKPGDYRLEVTLTDPNGAAQPRMVTIPLTMMAKVGAPAEPATAPSQGQE